MRLGNFWGLPAPMMLIAFDGEYEKLNKYLSTLVQSNGTDLAKDVRKELLWLLEVCKTSAYQLPEYQEVSSGLSPLATVEHGNLPNSSDLVKEQFITEVAIKVIQQCLKDRERGKFYRVPADLRVFVADFLENTVFKLRDLGSVVKNIVKSFPASEVWDESLVTQFQLKECAPDFVYIGDERVMLDDLSKSIWEYYSKRKGAIADAASHCVSGKSKGETVFDISFFDLIKRKPISLKYLIIEIFDLAKEHQTAHLVPKCKRECQQELATFRECLDKYVESDLVESSVTIMTHELFEELLGQASEECRDFFRELQYNHRIYYADYQKEDFEMFIDLFEHLNSLPELSSVFNGSTESIIDSACSIGVYGLNEFSKELFVDALVGTSLVGRGKLKKSEEDLRVLNEVLGDADALLDSLIPVGEVIA